MIDIFPDDRVPEERLRDILDHLFRSSTVPEEERRVLDEKYPEHAGHRKHALAVIDLSVEWMCLCPDRKMFTYGPKLTLWVNPKTGKISKERS